MNDKNIMIDNKDEINLIPTIQNPSPDYYCTWQTQLYATSDGKPEKQRECICEKALFDNEKPYGWAYFYEAVRKDLLLVMDDSWDVPLKDYTSYYGSLRLDREKFPTSYENAIDETAALKDLTNKIKAFGWKGLGGWVCAQESSAYMQNMTQEEYWIERLNAMRESGFSYWKVDWGSRGVDAEFRKQLTTLGKKFAPELVIEHAMTEQVIPYSDVYRTYDVPAIMSIPMTLTKLEDLAQIRNVKNDCESIINCEDEAYIAAAGGFSMGVMRHPYAGQFLNGKEDMSFPSVHRNLKTKMTEIIRAVNWHKLAPAYSFDGNELAFSENYIYDTWNFEKPEEEIETWWFNMPLVKDDMKGNLLTKKARAIIARNMELPAVEKNEDGAVPFVIASKNPNGAYSVATLGRTMEREYKIPLCDITINCKESKTVGVFGEYKNLYIKTELKNINQVLMQDLAGKQATDVTEKIIISGDLEHKRGVICVPGSLIHDIGTSVQLEEDTSEPGVVIVLV